MNGKGYHCTLFSPAFLPGKVTGTVDRESLEILFSLTMFGLLIAHQDIRDKFYKRDTKIDTDPELMGPSSKLVQLTCIVVKIKIKLLPC